MGRQIGQGSEIKEIPIPIISDQDILVKIHAVALNPIDRKYIDLLSPKGSRIGCDYAGTVTKVGKSAKGSWKVGDRVAGMVHGGISPDVGSFAEYIKIEGDLAWKVPEEITDAAAATYGISPATAMLALNTHLGVPFPDNAATVASPTPSILIYSGSTTVGIAAIQWAKAAGYRVVTTASPHSFDLVKSYGADAVFNYRSPTAVKDITSEFPNIALALDCISEGPSTHFCAEVLAKEGGKVVTLLDNGKPKIPNVTYEFIVIFTVFAEEFAWLPPIGPKFPANPSDRNALVQFYANLPSFLDRIKPPPIQLVDGGFNGILKGLDQLREGKVSGKKLVVKLQ
ncbi:putative ToxD-like zinc binding oxidoreductase [Bisporella sp. PMI_857]|nr:putative ToxD-like zinc binding oxidoreductase [Bisporella sp. PMI_857]